jgi:KDO2-lipid IV(A) lauroyltransferase
MVEVPAVAAATQCESPGLRLRYAVFGVVFFLGYRLFGLRRAVIRENLRRSFPERNPRELRCIQSDFVARQAETFAEIDYSRRIGAEELRQRVRLSDPAGVLGADGSSRGVILVTGHQCNFEWVLLRLSLELGAGLVALYKPLNGALGERYFHKVRTRFGARLMPAKSVTRELGAIRDARALGMVADQVPRTSPDRYWTRFLHQDTAFFKGPERLGRALRSRIVYVSMRRLGRGRYEIELEPLTTGERLPNGAATERYVRVLERDIEADPAGWWWSHRRWKLTPPSPAAVGRGVG